MADRFLKSAPARLRHALANLQILPALALFLAVGATVMHWLVLPGREAAIEESERRLASLERDNRRAQLENRVEHVTPDDTRQRLLGRFPTEAQLNAELGRLLALAEEQGVQVPTGDYRLMPGKDGLFDRYVLNLPVKGSYQTVRQYVLAVRSEFPDLAVDDITLRRENTGSGEVEAQLRFVLFGRRHSS